MAFRFDPVKAHHVLLFFIRSLGGSTDISRLYLLLYLADLKHLAKHGVPILGDNYIAMKYGPAPSHVLEMLRQLQEHDVKNSKQQQPKLQLAINGNNQLEATAHYNALHLSDSEVECMFEIIRSYKNMPFGQLSDTARDKAWNNADTNGQISLTDMAAASGADAEMISYIEQAYRNEINPFKHGT